MTTALRQDFVLRRLDGSVTYPVTRESPKSANARMSSDTRSLYKKKSESSRSNQRKVS